MRSPSAFLVLLPFLVLVVCSLSAATEDGTKNVEKEISTDGGPHDAIPEAIKEDTDDASAPIDSFPSEKVESAQEPGKESYYYTKDVNSESGEPQLQFMFWHQNGKH